MLFMLFILPRDYHVISRTVLQFTTSTARVYFDGSFCYIILIDSLMIYDHVYIKFLCIALILTIT